MLLRGGCTDFLTEVQSEYPTGRVWIYKEDIQKSKPLHIGHGVRHEKKPMGCCKKPSQRTEAEKLLTASSLISDILEKISCTGSMNLSSTSVLNFDVVLFVTLKLAL